MIITPLQKNNLPEFCHTQGTEDIDEKSLLNLWDNEISKPGWCFILETDQGQKGRIGFLRAGENSLNMFGLYLPNSFEGALESPVRFLTEIFHLLQKEGIRQIHYHLESDAIDHLMTLEALKKAGMQVTQTKKSLTLQEKDFNKLSDNRLEYKSLSEIGKPAFLQAMQIVTHETLDREDEKQYDNNRQNGAEEHFSFLQEIGDREDSWYLAYSRGVFVGLVIPQLFNKQTGAINYIGVDPKQRGKGYVVDLLDKGIASLFERNAQYVIADIDELNFPMEKALIKMGFVEVKKIRVLSISLV